MSDEDAVSTHEFGPLGGRGDATRAGEQASDRVGADTDANAIQRARPSLVQEALWTTADFIESARLHAEAALHPEPPDRYRHGDPAKPTVLLLPGVYETWNFLRVIADALNEDGYRIAPVGGLGYNLLPIAETATRLTKALRALPVPSGGRAILAHSHRNPLRRLAAGQVHARPATAHLRPRGRNDRAVGGGCVGEPAHHLDLRHLRRSGS